MFVMAAVTVDTACMIFIQVVPAQAGTHTL